MEDLREKPKPIYNITKEQYLFLSNKFGWAVFHREFEDQYQIKIALGSYKEQILNYINQ